MTLESFHQFLNYYSKVRKRTLRVISCIPEDQLDWRYAEGKFSFADLMRHLGATERFMYGETVQGKPSTYKGCGPELAEGHEAIMHFLSETHEQSMAIFSGLTEEQINGKCLTPTGHPITVWKWLRLMAEHEIHHRGQIYMYLGILNIPSPPIYGLTAEELAKLGQ